MIQFTISLSEISQYYSLNFLGRWFFLSSKYMRIVLYLQNIRKTVKYQLCSPLLIFGLHGWDVSVVLFFTVLKIIIGDLRERGIFLFLVVPFTLCATVSASSASAVSCVAHMHLQLVIWDHQSDRSCHLCQRQKHLTHFEFHLLVIGEVISARECIFIN